jgi:hypothetical protein
MIESLRFAVLPDHYDAEDFIFAGYPLWEGKLYDAVTLAHDRTEESGVPHVVMEWVCTIHSTDTSPTSPTSYNGVTPGVDFPATLNPATNAGGQ